MNNESTIVFYSNKPRLIHIALNIALAPLLLYLVGIWPWPPTTVHFIVFAITAIIAFRYLRERWRAPRLTLDDKGLHCGKFYPAETILKADSTMRALRLTLKEDGEVNEKIIRLGWASNNDIKSIIELINDRFNPNL